MLTLDYDGCGNVKTVGLAESVGFDLQISSVNSNRRTTAGNLLSVLADYFVSGDRSLVAGERIDWASSLLIARQVKPGIFALDELDFDGTSILEGADSALTMWDEQSKLCRSEGVTLQPCRFGEHIAVSPGALQRQGPLEGVRYAPNGVMTGWFITTPEYDGEPDNFASMYPTHTFHVLRARRDVARYLGLPPGFAFKMAPDEKVWFESDIAGDST